MSVWFLAEAGTASKISWVWLFYMVRPSFLFSRGQLTLTSHSSYAVAQLTVLDFFLVSNCTLSKSVHTALLLITSYLAAEMHNDALSLRMGVLCFTEKKQDDVLCETV